MICQQGFVFQSYKCLGVTCETLEGKKIFRVEEGVKGRHFLYLTLALQWKGKSRRFKLLNRSQVWYLKFLPFYCVEGEIRKWANWAFFVVCPPRFLCWVATVCTWTLLPFTKVSIELRNPRKNFLKKPCKGKQKFEMYAKLGYSIEKSIC